MSVFIAVQVDIRLLEIIEKMLKFIQRNFKSFKINPLNNILENPKPYSDPLCFAYCIRPIHILAKMFGLLCFSIKFNKENEMIDAYVKIFDVVWLFIHIGSNILSLYGFFNASIIANSTNNSTIIAFHNILRAIGIYDLSLIIFCQIFEFYNRSKLVDILKEFNAFDKEVC